MAEFCNAFEKMSEKFDKYGFEPFKKEYLDAWMHTDQPVEIVNELESNTSVVIKGNIEL